FRARSVPEGQHAEFGWGWPCDPLSVEGRVLGLVHIMADSTISHYRIVEKLGEGGMGAVYRAEDVVLRRDVAIKILHSNLAGENDLRLRLLREARTAAALNHPNICTIHEVGEVEAQLDGAAEASLPGAAPGTPFIVMELLRGRTLQALLAGSGALPF